MKKYQQLFKQIQKTIQNETYAVGDFLPSEHDLMNQYQVSRDTVRKALSLLQEEGLIKKIRGGKYTRRNRRYQRGHCQQQCKAAPDFMFHIKHLLLFSIFSCQIRLLCRIPAPLFMLHARTPFRIFYKILSIGNKR